MAGKRKRGRPERSSDIKNKRCRLSGMEHSHENVVKHSILTQYYPRVLTLGEYLRSKLPSNSKARIKRIISLESGSESVHGADKEGKNGYLGNFLVSTLVGVLEEDKQRKDERWAQWTSYSQLADNSDATVRTWDREEECSQSEVGSSSSQLYLTVVAIEATMTNQDAQIVDFTIWQLFKNSSKSGSRVQHLLCQGYRKDLNFHAIHHNENATSAIPGVISAYPNHHVTTMKSFPWPQVLVLMGREGHRVMIDLILDCGIFVAVESGQGNYNQLSGKSFGNPQS
jgi:telomerase reverse transcriptase